MNTQITSEVFKATTNGSLLENLIILIIYIIVSICFLKFCIDKGKKLDDNFWYEIPILRKIFYKDYKNIAKKEDANDIYLTPLQAGYLIDKKIKNYHIIATILHFLDLGIIKLEKIYRKDKTFAYRFSKYQMEFCDYSLYSNKNLSNETRENLRKRGISISEICIIDKIVFKYYNYINADRIFELYDSKDDYSKLYNLREINEVKELKMDKDLVEKCISNEYIELGLYSYKGEYNLLGLLPSKLYSDKIKLLYEYKNKLQKDTFLPERNIENVYLWGEHLIYGVALNVCKASIKDAIKIYEGKIKR